MHALVVVAYYASLVHFCSTAAEVVLPGSELVPKGLLASVADFYCLGFVIVGSP